MATSGSTQARETSRMDETETRASTGGEPEMALALGDRLCKCLWAALSVRHFQKEKLVITIKRPYYIADFLEKSVFYWAGPQTHTHTLLATRHRNRSEQGLAWEETVKGSGQTHTRSINSGGSKSVCIRVR